MSDTLTPTPTPHRSPSETRWPLLLTATVLIILPILTISQVAAHYRVDVVDDQMFGYYGWRVAHGATLYNDVWDNKPPAVYWTNALGFLIGNDSYGGVIALCALAVTASIACYFVISASIYYRGAAAAGTILAAFFLTHGFFQGGTNRTETYLMAFELAAVALYFRGHARDQWWKWLLAGMCCGCAFLYKQVGLAAWGAMGLHTIILVVLHDVTWRDGLKRCLLLLAGVVVVVGAAVAVIVAQGAADAAWFAVFTFNNAYFTEGKSSLTDFGLNDYMLREHLKIAMLLPILMTIAALIHAVLWRLRPNSRPADIEEPIKEFNPVCPRYMLLFFIWYMVAYYGSAISPHYFRHYLLPTMPPMMLMSGYLINILRGEFSLLKRLQQRIWVTACFVAMGYFALQSLHWHVEAISRVWVYRFIQGRQADWEVVGDAVRRMTEPDDTIQCLGYWPGVYLSARRPNASRYITTEKIGQTPDSAEADIIRKQLTDQLAAHPPTLLIVNADEYEDILEEKPPPDCDEWLGWWLQSFIPANYERELEVTECNVLIFRRK